MFIGSFQYLNSVYLTVIILLNTLNKCIFQLHIVENQRLLKTISYTVFSALLRVQKIKLNAFCCLSEIEHKWNDFVPFFASEAVYGALVGICITNRNELP